MPVDLPALRCDTANNQFAVPPRFVCVCVSGILSTQYSVCVLKVLNCSIRVPCVCMFVCLQVVDSKVSRYIEVVEGSNFGAVGGGAAAAAAAGEGPCATAWPEGVDETTPSSSVGGYGLEDMSMDRDAETDSEGDGEAEEGEGQGEEGEGGVSAGGGGSGSEGATPPAAPPGGSEGVALGQGGGMAWGEQEEGGGGAGVGVGSPPPGLLPSADGDSEELQEEEGGGAGVGSPHGPLLWGQQQQLLPIADDDSGELQEEEGGVDGVASPPGFLSMGSDEEGGGAAEGAGSSGWRQPDPVAAAKAARGARQAGMRDVAAAAAGVGVVVRLLPVKRWQDWYKEMLE